MARSWLAGNKPAVFERKSNLAVNEVCLFHFARVKCGFGGLGPAKAASQQDFGSVGLWLALKGQERVSARQIASKKR